MGCGASTEQVSSHNAPKSKGDVKNKAKPPKNDEEDLTTMELGEEHEKAARVIQKNYKKFKGSKEGKSVSRMIMCHLCGQKFGSTSISIHLKPDHCAEQRMNDYKANLPKELVPKTLPSGPTRPLPDPETGTQSEVDAYNEEAYEIFTKNSLCHCPICSRGFEPDRLTQHLNNCKDKDGHTYFEHQAAKAIQNNWGKHQTKVMLFCYCCGQEYGTKSLGIHIPECIIKREANWKHSGLPEELIKPCPTPPNLPIPQKGQPVEDFKAYNTEARTIYMESMAQCPTCDRKFEPDRLVVHMHSCNGKVHHQ